MEITSVPRKSDPNTQFIYDLRFANSAQRSCGKTDGGGKVNYNFGGVRIFLLGHDYNFAPPLGGLSASPDPSDQGESSALSPLDPSLRGGFLVREGLRSPPYNPPAATMPLHAFFFLYCLLSLVIAPSLLARHFLVSDFIHMSIFRTL